MRYNEKRGHWPLMKRKRAQGNDSDSDDVSGGEEDGNARPEKEGVAHAVTAKIRTIEV